jgi:hypothetical protein
MPTPSVSTPSAPATTSPRSPVPVDGAEQQRRALLSVVKDLDPQTSPRSKTLSGVPTNVMRSNRASELTVKSITRGEPVNGRDIPVRTKLTLTAPDYAGDAVIKGKLDLPQGVRLLEGDASNVVFQRRVTSDGRPFYEATLSLAVDPAAQRGQPGGWSAVKPTSYGVTLNSYPPRSENRVTSPYPQGPLAFSNVPLVP